ncbi:MAG: hypothetical protein OEW35_09000 [Gammaproteobacteria bacterium]|nr:hypothetical protein [Gammaproteobacteria bacterium]MDH4253600.1 hypothetical protein [Gammaproteobacteria bacterium]MDH5310363.1 hypothetical protein [Gammaproteobacteria bacterium]
MQRLSLAFCATALAGMAIAAIPGLAEEAPARPLTIREIMESVITPASDILWAVEDPQSDEDWRALEHAAIATIAGSVLVAQGGAGPEDDAWASEPEWRAFNGIMLKAATDGLAAIRARDLDALYNANDALYPPCEGCHVAFNPGVQ